MFLFGKSKKKQIRELTEEISKLKEENSKLYEIKLTSEQTKHLDLSKEITNLKSKKNEIESLISSNETKLEELNLTIKEKEQQLSTVEDDLFMESFGLYKPRYDFANSSGYKEKLNDIRKKQKSMIRDKTAVDYFSEWTVDGSKSKGRKMTNDNIKMALRAFNNECEASINKIKFNNIESIEKKIIKSAETINKLNKTNRVSISPSFIELKKEELYLAYEYELKKQEEKEALREQRRKEKEEKALSKEIESKKKKIDKEVTHLNNLIKELEHKLATASEDKKESILKNIDDAKNNINTYNDEKKDLDYRIENTGAGYVYIISNIGAFGENVFKIGVTRRLDPMERIRELSSASVPFAFDVHAIIFSYDAYGLETELHTIFDNKKVNMINNRKEFFNITIEDIEKQLQNYKDLTIDFKKIPEAKEFRETQLILEQLELNNNC